MITLTIKAYKLYHGLTKAPLNLITLALHGKLWYGLRVWCHLNIEEPKKESMLGVMVKGSLYFSTFLLPLHYSVFILLLDFSFAIVDFKRDLFVTIRKRKL